MADWRVNDNKVICLNLINRYIMIKNTNQKLMDMQYINKLVNKIMRQSKCTELEATIQLKENFKKEYKNI